jgi:hypothetical protein
LAQNAPQGGFDVPELLDGQIKSGRLPIVSKADLYLTSLRGANGLFDIRICSSPSRRRPRKRAIQYSEAPVMESRSRGVLDTRFRGYDGFL